MRCRCRAARARLPARAAHPARARRRRDRHRRGRHRERRARSPCSAACSIPRRCARRAVTRRRWRTARPIWSSAATEAAATAARLDRARRRPRRSSTSIRPACASRSRCRRVPAYYAPHMELSAEIDRGDVFYDEQPPPFRRIVAHRPSIVLYVDDHGTKRALVRWPTTIGGWADQRMADGSLVQRWKESDVGPRVWRDIFAGPTWLAPKSTPDRELVQEPVERPLGAQERRVRPRAARRVRHGADRAPAGDQAQGRHRAARRQRHRHARLGERDLDRQRHESRLSSPLQPARGAARRLLAAPSQSRREGRAARAVPPHSCATTTSCSRRRSIRAASRTS